MKEDRSDRPFEEYFSEQVMLNEQFRSTALLAVVACLLVYVATIFLLYREIFEQLNVEGVLAWLILILVLVLVRTYNIRRIIGWWQRKGRPLHPALQYANSLIELSIPTVGLIMIAQFLNGTVALLSPAVFLYFIFILLSILELDSRLSVISGVVAAGQYLVVVIYYLSKESAVPGLEVLNYPFIYLSKVIILLLAGIIAGLAAQQIKKRIIDAYNATMERHRVEKLFGQQISPKIVDELISSGQEIVSRKRFACVMFLDIRGFTRFCEDKSPAQIVRFQNAILSFMIDAVNRHHGIVNQILGDGFMATFGAPLSSGHDCQDAVTAALEILDELKEKSKAGTIAATEVGIGLHYGEVITGNVGTARRKQYSITGNVVILASRLEQLNKKFNTHLLISSEVLDQIDMERLPIESVTAQSMGPVQVKGRSKAMEIYKLA